MEEFPNSSLLEQLKTLGVVSHTNRRGLTDRERQIMHNLVYMRNLEIYNKLVSITKKKQAQI